MAKRPKIVQLCGLALALLLASCDQEALIQIAQDLLAQIVGEVEIDTAALEAALADPKPFVLEETSPTGFSLRAKSLHTAAVERASDVQVRAIAATGQVTRTTVDANGAFSLAVSAGAYTVIAERRLSNGGTFLGRTQIEVSAGQTATLPEPIFIQDAGALYGVAQLQGESSHAGILVYVDKTDLFALTDEQGRYIVPALPVGAFRLVFARSGYVIQTVDQAQVKAGQPQAVESVELEKDTAPIVGKGKINGTVFGIEGAPLAGALISVAGAAVPAVSDQDGKFEMILDPNSYRLIAVADGYEIGTVDVVAIKDGETAASLTLAPAATFGYGLVSGAVTDSTTGEGLSSVLVVANPPRNQVFTGQTGNFSFNLPVGCYSLNIATGGYSSTVLPLCVGAGDEIELGEIGLRPDN